MTGPPQLRVLPLPWVIASRKLARRTAEHIDSCHRIIARQQAEIVTLHGRLDRMERAGKR